MAGTELDPRITAGGQSDYVFENLRRSAVFSSKSPFHSHAQPCEQVFDKWGASSFFQTPLAAYFTRHGVDTVAVCGRIVPLGRKRKSTPRQQTAVNRCAADTSLNTRELGANEMAAVDRSAAAPPPAACERRFEAAAISVSAAAARLLSRQVPCRG